jgi:hypothetical protein
MYDMPVPMPMAPKRDRQMEAMYQAGITEGRQRVRKELLDLLEKKYMSIEGPAGEQTAKSSAILEVTREVSLFLKGEDPATRRRRA